MTAPYKGGPKGIEWDAQPLGEITDTELARRLGVDRGAVGGARRRRGIPRYERGVEYDYSDVPLGTMSDAKLAAKIGRSAASVRAARVRRGIPSWRSQPRPEPDRKWRWIKWDRYPLGERPDDEIARLAGVWPSTVAVARLRRGIPAYQYEITCPCGETFMAAKRFARFCSKTCQMASGTHSYKGRPKELEGVACAMARLRSEINQRRSGR